MSLFPGGQLILAISVYGAIFSLAANTKQSNYEQLPTIMTDDPWNHMEFVNTAVPKREKIEAVILALTT